MKPIIAAVDFPDLGQGQGVVSMATDLARGLESPLVLLHVVDPERDPESAEDNEELLEKIAEHVRTPGLTVITLVARGGHAAQIVATARRMGAGMLVVGRHGRSGLRSLLMGSTSQEVLRDLPCPVTVVPLAPEPITPPDPTAVSYM
ncbi:MAG: universal stress protein [Nitrospirota bacterium]|nr:universal stress protein [Nitrospirota bacterium]